ncbi:response regulator [Rubrivirga marina]|uniref:DNA-binding response regulator n=1 Tax=Rubrivirga marina TaxID=1196024 RepID=A0A271IXR4_9BACT|nr:response regulator transcription factor [Rubrivirga marina]PAP75920.1 DNA-binding response regulator [Rubrivirga marina]
MSLSTKILLVDDHPLLRTGLAMTLDDEPDFEIVGQAADAEEALDVVDRLDPDLVVVDLSLPGMGGIELVKHLQTIRPQTRTLVVSRHDESLYAERAVRAGAKGYVSKLEAGEKIVEAVRTVLRGGIFLSEDVKDKMLFGAAAGRDPMASPLEVLSDRELEVFEMTGRGVETKEVAERLHLSVKTVESYRARIKTKLGLTNSTELIAHAVRWVEDNRAD